MNLQEDSDKAKEREVCLNDLGRLDSAQPLSAVIYQRSLTVHVSEMLLKMSVVPGSACGHDICQRYCVINVNIRVSGRNFRFHSIPEASADRKRRKSLRKLGRPSGPGPETGRDV